ncbi:ComEA family DNA-binding protein [Collimonas pratensis]|uniref:Helix-hairpin-helix motif family protein n=1 Tax=Collimonas pratensis TaxID=279113 RepID=A0ABM5ZCR5_9BURK|nr:helix-hairpin-helix domain-containing protein [Collimonas pratensis]AMP16732.1 helix-hairpin-helix motif family protein [Collimonas pratensis]NKI72697.1 helix-hairpin-helix domain-containing protein [Collimonas pratensis]
MLKKLLLIICMLMASASFAQVDVNKGDAAALDGIKGIGASTAKRIIDERTKGGNFKDWSDFESRVQGIGEKKAVKLSQAGLQVNGKAKGDAAAAPPAKVAAKAAAKPK